MGNNSSKDVRKQTFTVVEPDYWYPPQQEDTETTTVNRCPHLNSLVYFRYGNNENNGVNWVVLIEDNTTQKTTYIYREVMGRSRRKNNKTFFGLMRSNRYCRLLKCCMLVAEHLEQGDVSPELVFDNIKKVLDWYRHYDSSPERLLCKTSRIIHYVLGVVLKEAILANHVDMASKILRYFDRKFKAFQTNKYEVKYPYYMDSLMYQPQLIRYKLPGQDQDLHTLLLSVCNPSDPWLQITETSMMVYFYLTKRFEKENLTTLVVQPERRNYHITLKDDIDRLELTTLRSQQFRTLMLFKYWFRPSILGVEIELDPNIQQLIAQWL